MAGLREVLLHTPTDLCFVSNDVDSTWASWCGLFLSAIKDNVPTCKARDNRGHPWIDSELVRLIKKKNKQRNKARKTGCPVDVDKFKGLRRLKKKLMMQKRRPSAHKISESLFDNPKRFWSFVNASTLLRYTPRNDRKAVTNVYEQLTC